MAVHTHMHVYLAGPILGCTQGEANDWRKDVAARLAEHHIIGVSPLRCEPLHGETYSADYPDPRFGTPDAISSKNKFDVDTCDMGLYYVPRPGPGDETAFNAWMTTIASPTTTGLAPSVHDAFLAGYAARRLHSFGTLGEMFWANKAGKQTVLVTDDPFILKHPVIRAAASWKLDNFNDAVDVIVGVLGGYAGGKNV